MAEEKEKERKKKGAKTKKPRKKEPKPGAPKRPGKAKKVKAKKPKHPPKEKGVEVNVYTLDGKVKGSSELPDAFHSEIRPDLIRRAVGVFLSNKRQPSGTSPLHGIQSPRC